MGHPQLPLGAVGALRCAPLMSMACTPLTCLHCWTHRAWLCGQDITARSLCTGMNTYRHVSSMAPNHSQHLTGCKCRCSLAPQVASMPNHDFFFS